MLGNGPAIELKKMPILAKKNSFSDEVYFDFGGYVNKPNCRIWGTMSHTLKSRCTQSEKRFGADFGPEA